MISPERFTSMQNSAVVTGNWYGVDITASATPHAKGSWTSLIASTSFHAYMASVTIGEVAAATTDTSMLIDIGYDPAAGTTYTVEIPNILGHGANPNGFRTTMFPVSIPKGSQVAARCQALIVSDTVKVGIVLLGGANRSNPWPHRGSIQDYGTDTATSGGTGMAPAVLDTKPAWTQLGADTTRRHSGLVVCAAGGDAATVAARYSVDIGLDPAGGTTYGVVIPDIPVILTTSEQGFIVDPLSSLLSIDIPSGAAIAARAASSVNNSQSDLEVAVYAF